METKGERSHRTEIITLFLQLWNASINLFVCKIALSPEFFQQKNSEGIFSPEKRIIELTPYARMIWWILSCYAAGADCLMNP